MGFGIFDGKNVYNYKGITAEITDSGNNKWFVPIKYILGDYFVTLINNQTYVFKIVGSRIKNSKRKGAMTFQTLDYNTEHYMPVSGDVKELEMVLLKNKLPPVNSKLHGIMKILGRTEKPDFVAHDLIELIEKLSNSKNKYQKEVAELLNYFGSLSIDKIVTPLGRISEFIETDLKATDAKVIGDVFVEAVEIDKDHKSVTNVPVSVKKSYLVMILIMIIIMAVVGLLWMANEAGKFDNLGASIPGIGGGGANYSKESLMKKYPSGVALRAAVDSGELKYESLPKDVQVMVDKVPSAKPIVITP